MLERPLPLAVCCCSKLTVTQAGLAMVVTALEFLTTSLSARRQGLHPGVLVAFHLITWLAALGAVVVTALYVAYGDFPDYEAPRTRLYTLVSQYVVYEQVVLGFDSVLLLAQFILFVGSCVETNAVEKARRGVVVVRVPYPAGAPYAGGQYPLYGPPQSLVAPPGSHPGQYPVPLMSQVPRQPDGKTAPAAPEPVALYGGYYAPAPPEMAWRASQQQANTTQPVYEYYAPAPAPTNRSARSSQPQSSAPPPASGSGSRRSQRHAQSQSAASPPPAPQQAPQQGPS
ncbi:uncharacterized protein THITE_2114593 [Thermothielavioides terrestris NRRL 8126]|uniref:Uncharacterized protein n=2 Tax=Thermothielavioides terrestris TaxID=2587410 RepID=G2R0K5_THETT|nr:uncharacterized protein THITE_2114593 [Thermothielavioides terrestris NRRL 8126]AEO66473.1 hypothetical protein THITE_2114593 [Thermothielavioides terrestris NRRL 8126]